MLRHFAKWFDLYFHCSRAERRGIFLLTTLVFLLFVAASGYGSLLTTAETFDSTPFLAEIDAFRQGIDTLDEAEEDDRPAFFPDRPAYRRPFIQKKPFSNIKKIDTTAVETFAFDPNTASEADLRRLGLSPKTVQSIVNYREKGGRFRQAADFGKIYTLSAADYARLEPFIQIAATPQPQRDSLVAQKPRFVSNKSNTVQVDVNRATVEEWQQLRGIGAGLAQRIVKYRESLGGFVRAEQVGETFGLPDSTFQKIRPQLVCSAFPLRKIALNTATEAQLKQHPYLKYRHIKSILQYQKKYGKFDSPDILQTWMEFDDGEDTYRRVRPYLE